MGFSKLREWVGTVTGKGDRWGRDRSGRSEPAFLSASTIALPPSTCTAWRGRPTSSGSCCFAARPAICWLLFHQGLCRAENPPAVSACSGFVLQAVCLLAFAMPCPLPFSTFCPPFILLFPCSVHVRQDRRVATVCKLQDCPVGSCNTGLQWWPVRRFLTYLFPAESMILGHGLV